VKLTFITIFPELITDFFKVGVLARAVKKGKLEINVINPREFTNDLHQTVDDAPYGGGSGMIMKALPLVAAIKKAVGKRKSKSNLVIMLAPSKKIFNQKVAVRLAKYEHLVFVCGRYEGIDARVEKYIDLKLSLGEFVLMGGEVAALAVSEATLRLVKDVLGNQDSLTNESYSLQLYLEYPQYTRPEVFEGAKVPKILLSGHHQKILEWRKKKSK